MKKQAAGKNFNADKIISHLCKYRHKWVCGKESSLRALTSGSLGIWISLLKYNMSLALLKKVLRLWDKKVINPQ